MDLDNTFFENRSEFHPETAAFFYKSNLKIQVAHLGWVCQAAKSYSDMATMGTLDHGLASHTLKNRSLPGRGTRGCHPSQPGLFHADTKWKLINTNILNALLAFRDNASSRKVRKDVDRVMFLVVCHPVPCIITKGYHTMVEIESNPRLNTQGGLHKPPIVE